MMRRRFAFAWIFSIVLCSFMLLETSCARAATSAGTSITETMTMTYQDASSNNYNATSNTVTTVVANVPTLSVSSPTGKNVTVGQQVVDTFTLTNTGNSSGAFQLNADATNAGNATATLLGYVLNGASLGPCSTAQGLACSLATLQTQLAALSPTAANGTITIGVEYQVTSTTYSQTLQYAISPIIVYVAGSGTATTASSSVTSSSFSDTIWSDARLDIQVTSTPPPNGGASLTWVVKANDGGNYPARDSVAAQNLLGAGAAGVAIVIRVPIFSGAALALPVTAPTAPTVSGDTVTMYYSSKAVGSVPSVSSDWSTTYSSSATWIAIYLSGGSGSLELSSATGSSSGAGAVTGPQVTYTFTTAQPSGNGSGSTNAATLVANSVLDGHVWDTGAGTYHSVLAPGIASGTADSSSQSLTATVSNTTAGSGTTWPGGASNQAGNNAYTVYSLLNGPMNNPSITGSCPVSGGTCQTAGGSGAATNNLDFTAVNTTCNGSASVNGSNCTIASAGINIPAAVQNTGNGTDTIQLTAYAPSGWTVQLFNVGTCTPSSPSTAVPSCTTGSSITGASSAGGNISGNVSVASAASLTYVAQYIASSTVTPFVGVDGKITATGQSGSGTGSDTNDTHDDIYPGGVVKLTNSVVVTSTNCPAGMSPSNSGACPGAVLTYSIAYLNVAPAASTGTNVGGELSWMYAALNITAGSLVITADGGAAGNVWDTDSFGLNAAPSDTTSGTTYVYTPNIAFATGTYPNITAGPTKFVATVGGASGVVNAGGSGTITYNVRLQ